MIILGLDFGTSNTCISYFLNNKNHIVINEYGEYTTPSCIFFSKDDDEILYGKTAMECKRSGCLISNIKRLLGLTYSDYIQNTNVQHFFKHLNIERDNVSEYCSILLIHNNVPKKISVSKIIEIYLKWLLESAKSSIDNLSNDIIITVPVHFNIHQREIMKQCLGNIGYNVLRIINEPTSATLSYIYSSKSNNIENILVLDCGGGTTDCTILEADYDNLFFEVLETRGDPFLGGDDITNNLVTYIIKHTQNYNFSLKNIENIRNKCQVCKYNLSFKNNDKIIIDHDDNIKVFNISKTTFENINKSWFKSLENIIKQVSCNYKIDRIILVGGTTRIPYIKNILHNIFGLNIIIDNSLNPDHTVSIGAGIQGFMLTRENDENDITFVDTISMSLGIETIGGIMSPIISKNTIIPSSKTETFIATDDDCININIYQGEKRFVKDNLFLNSIKINTKKNDIVKITFDITSDGTLHIITRNETNKQNNEISLHNYKKKIQDEYVYEDHCDKLSDLDLSNLIMAKIELNNTFKLLQKISEENNKTITNNPEYNKLLNDTNYVLENYKIYTVDYLKTYKKTFEETWHKLHFT